MSVSKFQHVFDTWQVYPRVHYFQKRFKDIHNRFIRITSKGQYSSVFKKVALFDKLDSLESNLDKPLSIYVIGRENLAQDDLVVTTEPLHRAKLTTLSPQQQTAKKVTEEHGITVVVANVKIDDLGDEGLKEVLATINHYTSNIKKTIPSPVGALFIVCHTELANKASDFEEFRLALLKQLEKSFGLNLNADQIIFGAGSEMVSAKISQMLEKQIIEGFFIMKGHLQTFIRNKVSMEMETLDIVEAEKLIEAAQNFLKNGLGFVDILQDSSNKGEQFVEVVLRHLARITRCAVLDPLSLKHNLTQDTCNLVAHAVNFDDNLAVSVSKNTRYHLRKMQPHCEEMLQAITHNRRYRFPGQNFLFISYPYRDDIRPVVLQLEKDLSSVRRTVNAMKRLMFEINGNIKQSLFAEEDVKEPKPNLTIPDELMKRVLATEGVYGAGTMFGEFEIHVKDKKVETSLNELIDEYKLRQPVLVRSVLQKPHDFAGGQVEHGGVLESEFPGDRFLSGTLGTFADGNNDELYALTCGHIVYVEDDQEHNVYIKNNSNQRQLFAKSNPARTVRSGQHTRAFVDIAAVKVIDSVRPRCTKYLKDDDGMLKSADLLTDLSNLDSLYVYKYGAASHLTRGIICSADYAIAGVSVEDYVIIISSPPGSEDDDKYARPGDSGSVNCMPDVHNNKTVKAVSMLSGGDFKLDGLDDVLYLTFQLSKGLDTLREMDGGIDLNLPSCYGGQQMY